MKLNIDQNRSQADPFVVQYNNVFYMYVTGDTCVNLYKSENMYDWTFVGDCYHKENEKSYWAPCVIEIDKTYYLYVSTMPVNQEDTHTQRIEVAKSNRPEGPFTFVKFLIEPFSIDPHVVKSGNDLFMFYSINDYEAKRAGTLIVVDKMRSPIEMIGKPNVAVRPSLDEEIFMKDRFKNGQHWHTLEGPFYFNKGDYHYLMFSGNCYQNENYYIGYAFAKSNEFDLTKIKFQKYPNENTYCPLIKKNNEEEGTGHNSLLEIDNQYYVFYHGRDYGKNNNDFDTRTARMCKINVEKEIISLIKR